MRLSLQQDSLDYALEKESNRTVSRFRGIIHICCQVMFLSFDSVPLFSPDRALNWPI